MALVLYLSARVETTIEGSYTHMTKYIVDTSALMENLPSIDFENIIVSTLVLRELENHKSNYRNPDKQFAARCALRAIEENSHLLEFDFNQYPTFSYLSSEYDRNYTDNRLLESLFHYKNDEREVGLLTDDLSLRLQAKSFGFNVKGSGVRNDEPYQGSIKIPVTDHRVSHFYQMLSSGNHTHTNIFDCLVGEYILLDDITDLPEREKIIGAWKWTGDFYKRISMDQRFNSSCFTEVNPKNFRQAVAMESIKNNPVAVITGKAGSGKSYLAISYIMQQIEYFEEKVYIVTDNVPMRGSNTFGLKKGDLVEKILQSNLGSILKSKVGIDYTTKLIDEGSLNLVALEDIRGTSYNSIVYVTEGQNYSTDAVKTILERIEDGGKAILEGDQRQIDTPFSKGANNGFDRMFEVFKDSGYMGHVELIGNIRGGISELAEKM